MQPACHWQVTGRSLVVEREGGPSVGQACCDGGLGLDIARRQWNHVVAGVWGDDARLPLVGIAEVGDRKSTRLNSSHLVISYAVFCLKKKKLVSRLGGSAAFEDIDTEVQVGFTVSHRASGRIGDCPILIALNEPTCSGTRAVFDRSSI